MVRSVAVGPDGSAFVAGSVLAGFPTTPGAFSTSDGGAFVGKLNPAATNLSYSTTIPGIPFPGPFSDPNFGDGIAIDTGGNAYVTGMTRSHKMLTRADAFQRCHGGGSPQYEWDVVVVKVDPVPGPAQVFPPPCANQPSPPPPVRPPPVPTPRVLLPQTSAHNLDPGVSIVVKIIKELYRLTLFAEFTETCNVHLTGFVSFPFISAADSKETYKFKPIRRTVAANERTKFRLKLPRKALKKVAKALRRGKKLVARLKLTAIDTSGNKTVKRYKIRPKL
jgi:hypothetical protein